tara:strand:- start:62255 stop:63700 length:1446 start_codon:yes stop_codon:yes gene_type:complete
MKFISQFFARQTLFLFGFFLFSTTLSAQEKVWSLQDCIAYALENNIQVKQSEINQEISERDLAASKYNVLPDLNGFASHGYNFGQSIDPFTNEFATTRVRNNSFSLSTNFTIFNGFRNINTIQRNKSQLQAAQYDLEKMKNDISLNVANAYLRILFNKEVLKNAANQLAVTQIQIDRISKQVSAGSLPEGALKDIEAQKATEELQRINADNDLKLATLNLVQLLQLEDTENFEVESPNLDNFRSVSELISPAALYATAVDIMPEIKSAEYNLYSAKKNKDIAQSGYTPTISFSGSLGTGYSGNNREVIGFTDPVLSPTQFFTSSNEDVFTFSSTPIRRLKDFDAQVDDNFNRSISFRMTIPIFNGFSSRINVQKAKLQMQSAELTMDNTKLQLRQDIERAHNDALAALKRYQAAEKSVDALETSFNYTQERFNVGMINSFEFNNEKNRLNNAQSELLQAKYNYIFSTKVLDFYQGKAITLD